MAGRCGCSSGTCTCRLKVKPPLKKEGEGTTRDAWVVSLPEEAIADMLKARLGPGLRMDPNTRKIQVRLSDDEDNMAAFGSDNGVQVESDGEGPDDPEQCGRSIADLPKSGVTAAYLLAGLINPFNSPAGLQYCIAQGIHVAHVRTVATADGVAWLAEYSSGNVSAARSTITADGAASRLDMQTIASTWNECGNLAAPQPGDAEGRPDGGWYGWCTSPYQNWFLPELLEKAGGKIVVLADCTADDGEGNYVDEVQNVLAAARAGKQMCCQKRLFIGVADLKSVETVDAQGFEAIMLPPFVGGKVRVGEKKPPYTTAELKDAEVKWCALSEKYDDAVFEEYKDAGISVLMLDSSRQFLAERADKVARGRMNMDPVYARGPEEHDYRGQYDPWARHRMCLGQLCHNTDDFEVTGTGARGYTKLDSKEYGRKNGLVIPARFGGGYGRPSILVGRHCPIEDEEYTITWGMQCETLPGKGTRAAGKIGLLFGAETDEAPVQWPDKKDSNPSGWKPGPGGLYRAYLRVDGRIGIGVWNKEHEYQSKEAKSPAPKENQWINFRLTVKKETVTLERLGKDDKADAKVTANSSAWRGPYWFVEKEEGHPGDDKYGFRAGFRIPEVGKA